MRSFFRILFFVLPLTLLISLPCEVKREIKRHLKVQEETRTNIPITKHITLCLEENTSNVYQHNVLKMGVTDYFPLFVNRFSFLFLQEERKDPSTATLYYCEILTVPLFILYKKLIIYF